MADESFDFSQIHKESGESVRHMLSALAKAIRTQSSDIKDIDQRISDGTFSRADAERWSLEIQSRFAEKVTKKKIIAMYLCMYFIIYFC